MIRRNTWILLAIFAVLLAGLIFLQKSGNVGFLHVDSTPASPTSSPLFGLDTGEASELVIQAQDGTLTDIKKMSDKWVVVKPEGVTHDADSLSTTVVGITAWTAMSDLSVVPPADSIGLSKPAYTLTLTLSSGQQRVINIGDKTPVGSGYYVQIDGATPVVVAESSVESVIQLLQNILATPTPEASPTLDSQSGTPQPAVTP